jgi:competence protein ComEA
VTEPEADDERNADGALAESARARSRWRVGVGAAVVLLMVGVGVAVVAGLLAPDGGVTPVVGPASSAGVLVTSAPTTPAAAVVVHVLGRVKRPGVYELPDGSRVIDAIGAAGGFAPDADQSGLNLAQELADGTQVLVPKPGEAAAGAGAGAAAGGGAGPGSASGAGGAASASGGTVDLNTATLEQLETLPRIGPSLAQRILDWRTQNGRFASVDDLKNVSGIGDKTFAGLEGAVTVG